jgi:cardiolipin synthase
MKKHYFRQLARRRIIVIVILFLQLAFFGFFMFNTSHSFVYIGMALNVASVFVVVYIVNRREKGEYRQIWILQILIFPFFGGLFYLLFQMQGEKRKFGASLNQWLKDKRPLYTLTSDIFGEAEAAFPSHAPLMSYLQNRIGFPVYRNKFTEYLPSGEVKFERLLRELEKSEKYIFLEYYMIKEGVMWDSILEILKRKAAEGLDVRLM